MGKRNKLPPVPDYVGFDENYEKTLIQKTNPLQTLSQTNLTLLDLKILDTYLARIDSHKPEKRYVRFEKGEIEEILGVEKINKIDLINHLKRLFQPIEIHLTETKSQLVPLFEKATLEKDDYGVWQVDLACHEDAMKFIFNPENLKYFKYRLGNVIKLTSRYSYVLYLYLEQHRKKEEWNVPLDELKQILNCKGSSYNAFFDFNDKVLKKSWKEINEKTTLKYDYTAIRKGRSVVAVNFQIAKQIGKYSKSEQLALPSTDIIEDENVRQYGSEQLTELAGACDFDFDKQQIEMIFEILKRTQIAKDTLTDSQHYGRVFYLKEQYTKFKIFEKNNINNGKPIKNRFAYFKKMLEENAARDEKGNLK